MFATVWSDTRGKAITVLVAIFTLWFLHEPRTSTLIFVIGTVGAMLATDGILGTIRHGSYRFSLSSVVTGLIIAFLLDPTRLGAAVTACLIASVAKHFLHERGAKHVFNPAAIGAWTVNMLLGVPFSWWAVSWGMAPLLVVLGMVPILARMRRLTLAISFIIVYFLSLRMVGLASQAFVLTIDPTIFFFALVMIPEPITSVAMGRWRWMWGVLVGIFVAGQALAGVSFGDPLLLALLAANAIGYVLVRRRSATSVSLSGTASSSLPRM